jgi:hypothetical protein
MTLDHVPRRYQWLRQWLTTYHKDHRVIFPPGWDMAEHVCKAFCDDTRRDLTQILKQWNRVNVKVLLQVLQLTIEFESMLDKYAKETRNLSDEKIHPEEGSSFKESPPTADKSVSSSKNLFISDKTTPSSTTSSLKEESDFLQKQEGQAETDQKEQKELLVFSGSLSCCFEPYLTHFVEAEDM